MSVNVINYTEYNEGDFVICNDCDTKMLVPMDADICPHCKAEGCIEYIQ